MQGFTAPLSALFYASANGNMESLSKRAHSTQKQTKFASIALLLLFMRHFYLLVLMLTCGVSTAQYVRIGDGNFLGTVGGPMVSDITNATYNSRFAYIYPRTVLGNLKHGDTIESIEFLRSAGAGLNGNCNLTIWLKNTSKSDFGAGRLHFPNETTGATRVYDQNPSGEIKTTEAYQQIPFFNRKFVFDTTLGENLELLVEYKQTAVQSARINWYFENSGTVSGFTTNQTKSYFGTALPDSLSNTSDYHPSIILNYPRIDKDIAVLGVYTLGKLPVPLGNPDSVKVLVRNVGKKDLSAEKIQTLMRGTNSGLDSTTVSLRKGVESFVNLPSLNPTKKGLDSVFAIALDANKSNNSARSFRLANENIYSYRDVTQSPAPGGIGFNGSTGDFVARFYSNKSKSINQVTVAFAITGRPFKIGIWEGRAKGSKPGKLLYISDSLSSVAGNYILDLKTPVTVNGNFFVGVRQIGTSNVAFGYQEENPVRPATFFYSTPQGDTNWVDFSPNAPFKFIIEPRLQGDTDMVAVSADFPKDSIDRYTMDTMAPKATISNMGAKDIKDSFTVVCDILQFGRNLYSEQIRDTMSAGLRRTYTFPKKFFPKDFGEHELRVRVYHKGDLINDNDTARRKFFVGLKKDVMVSSVFDPYQNAVLEYLKDTVMPTATIQNPGYDNSVTFTARCQILKGKTILYNQVRSLSLPKFQSRILTWPTYKCVDTGRLQFIFTTEMAGDKQRSNDTQLISIFVIKPYDILVDSVASPSDAVNYTPGKSIALRARVYNDGLLNMTDARLQVRITTAYSSQVFVDSVKFNMASKYGFLVTMPKSFVPLRKGLYRAVFRASYPGDRVAFNDSFVRFFNVGVPFDYTALSIDYPKPADTLNIGTGPFAPKVKIGNVGYVKNSDMVSFVCEVWFGNARIYRDVKSTNLDTSQVLPIDMLKTLNPQNAGEHRILLYTNYSKDVNRKNDSIWETFIAAISRDGRVVQIDNPAAGEEVAAKESSMQVKAIIASNGRLPLGPLKTTAFIFDRNGKTICTLQRNDTFLNAKEDKAISFSSCVLPDSGQYRLMILCNSPADPNAFNDTQQVVFSAYRNNDIRPVSFVFPAPGQWMFNTTGNKNIQVNIAQTGRDTSARNGMGYYRITDSVSMQSLFNDSAAFGGLKKPANLMLSSGKVFPFVITGSFQVAFWLKSGTDLYPQNDTLRTSFRVVFNNMQALTRSDVRLFPNPGNAGFRIQTRFFASHCDVLDISGKLLKQEKVSNGMVNMQDLPAGTYLVRVFTDKGNAIFRWVKSTAP